MTTWLKDELLQIADVDDLFLSSMISTRARSATVKVFPR